jgi:hypothetical protein
MNPDALKAAWQSQTSQRRLTMDADALLNEVRCKERSFRRIIFWRDVREVGVAGLMTVFFLWFGIKGRVWSLFVLAALLAGVVVFMIVDRLRQRRRQPSHSDPLLACVEESLAQINHQIWLLKNVFWWYLLPPGIGIALFYGQVSWSLLAAGLWRLKDLWGLLGGVLVVFGGVYWLNQYCVRKDLEPRRRELEALLQGLQDKDHIGNSNAGESQT